MTRFGGTQNNPMYAVAIAIDPRFHLKLLKADKVPIVKEWLLNEAKQEAAAIEAQKVQKKTVTDPVKQSRFE